MGSAHRSHAYAESLPKLHMQAGYGRFYLGVGGKRVCLKAGYMVVFLL